MTYYLWHKNTVKTQKKKKKKNDFAVSDFVSNFENEKWKNWVLPKLKLFFVVLLFSSGQKVNSPLKSKSYENCNKFWKKNLGQKNNFATV
jgi:uncharacterized membrane protein